MGSLLKQIKKNGIFFAREDQRKQRPGQGGIGEVTEWAASQKFPTILVNVQNVCNERPLICPDFTSDFEDITPGFESMWLEWIEKPESVAVKIACHVIRFPANVMSAQEYRDAWGDWDTDLTTVKHILRIHAFTEYPGRGGAFVAGWFIAIDDMGQVLGISCIPSLPDELDPNGDRAAHQSREVLAVALESLVRMNTTGTEVSPPWGAITDPKSNVVSIEIKKHRENPYSIWRTIYIGQIAGLKSEATATGAATERREHYIRAHRKDYRKGAGLFGRINKLIWFAEQKRGNPELGTVKQDYVVQ